MAVELRRIRNALQLLSDMGLPAQGSFLKEYRRLAQAADPIEELGAVFAPLGLGPEQSPLVIEMAFHALRQLAQSGETIAPERFVRLVGRQRSLGIGFLFEEGAARRVLLPAFSADDSLAISSEPISGDPVPVLELPVDELVRRPIVPQRPDRPLARRQIAEAIQRHAPPGSIFRRLLVHDLRQKLSFVEVTAGGSLNVDFFKKIVGELLTYLTFLAADERRLFSERFTYRTYLPKLLAFILDLQSNVRIVTKEGERDLRTYLGILREKPMPPQYERPVPADAVPAIWEFLGGPGQDEFFDRKIEDLRRFLAYEVLGLDGSFDADTLAAMKIAVVGYGLNLDAIAFFLDLGFDVTGIEKATASEGWQLHFAPVGGTRGDPFLQAIGLTDLEEASPHWDQFTPAEVTAALGQPERLHLYDALAPDLPVGTFDLVVVPAITDEAFETVVSLPRRGGYVLAEHARHPLYNLTTDSATFIRNAQTRHGVRFIPRYNAPFAGQERVLPTSFLGLRQVYLVGRN